MLETNVILACMIFIILLFRTLGRARISKSMIVHLWNLVLVRAFIPFENFLVKIPLVEKGIKSIGTTKFPVEYSAQQYSGNKMEKFIDYTAQGVLGKSESWQYKEYLAGLWLAGMILLILYFLRIYVREYRKLQKSHSVRNKTVERMIQQVTLYRKVGLEVNAAFITPVTYGIIHPKIVLPADLDNVSRVDMRNMIAHELIHIRRYDVAKKYLMALALCIHWFNPMVWIMFYLYQDDQEMSCDECVIRKQKEQEAKSYIHTMIKMAVEDRRFLIHTGFLERSSGKRRVLAAMNQSRMRKGKALAIVAVGFCLLPSLFFMPDVNSFENGDVEILSDGLGANEGSTAQLESINPLLNIEPETEEEFDYQAVMRDIEENYNDLSQPLTQEQELALTIQRMLRIQEMREEGRYP